jgi:xanthine dehydrogenase small subunit
MNTPILHFLRRGELVSLTNVPPDRTLLELLREDLGCTGTKEGCGEGDCGACTVVLGEADGSRLKFSAVNSCIRLAHSVNGLALWTVEDIASADGTPHPVQQAMVQCHASQCGFCTPGFVMSLFGAYQTQLGQGRTISREAAQEALSGNLCRCTGYRPILDAAQTLDQWPRVEPDTAKTLQQLKHLAQAGQALEADLALKTSYQAPRTLQRLLKARAASTQAQLVAGCTDVGLWVTKQHRRFERVIDITRVQELRRIEPYRHHIAIGAAVTLTDAFGALVAQRPQLKPFASRFAGLPVRNSGTLGGNVANGSPIGDSMPLLIACGANVVLMRTARGAVRHRELPLEQLYTGYRQNVMAPDEVLAWIKVPRPVRQERLRVYKISKRFDDDISAVCLALNLQISQGRVKAVSIGAGGVAATPARAVRTEAALRGQPWTQATVSHAIGVLRAEFQPISDMRASAAYRSEVLGNLLQRYWLESQGLAHINLESFSLDSLSPDSFGPDRVGPDSLAPDGAAPGRAGNSSAAEAA